MLMMWHDNICWWFMMVVHAHMFKRQGFQTNISIGQQQGCETVVRIEQLV